MRLRTSLPVILATTLVTGCASRRLDPVVPLPVNIVSSKPFVVHVAATDSVPASWCRSTRLRAKVAEVRGDTMFFASATSERRPMPSADCVAGGPGFLVLSSAPDARVEVVRVDPLASTMTILILIPIAIIGFLLLFGLG